MPLLNPSLPGGFIAMRPLPDLQTEAVMRAILDSIDHGVILTDLQDRSLACNARFGVLFDVAPEEVVRMSHDQMRERIGPLVVARSAWQSRLDEMERLPELRHEDEVAYRRGDLILRRVVSPVRDADGRLFGRLWTYTDVTESAQRRRNLDLLRRISAFADPDPAVALGLICNAVANHFGDTVAKITILDGDFLRFHVVAGDLGPAAGLTGLHTKDTYCGTTVGTNRTVVVQDARTDPFFSTLLPATVDYCRYLGVPVRDEAGQAIGTLCLIDQQMDRPLSPADVELMETVAIRANAELARERYLAVRIAEKDRYFEVERRELEETRAVLDSMNEAFALLFAEPDTDDLLREQARLLRGVLGYSASAVFLRRPGAALYDVAAWAAGADAATGFESSLEDYPALSQDDCGRTALDVRSVEIGDSPLRSLLGVPWVAVACLPAGEWGEAVVVLGRDEAPPDDDPRHTVKLAAVTESVRLVLAAHALNEGISEANRTVLGAQEKALASEKLAVVGTLAASTAHDIRNIVASLSMLAAPGGDPEASLAALREQFDRFNVLAHRLLSYARPGQVAARPVDLADLLDRVLALTSGQRRVSRVEARVELEETLPSIVGDAGQLQHLFVNLVLNAVQAMERTGGSLLLAAQEAGDGVEIRVVDDGPGIPAAVADRLFEPFASSRPQGFGLGLFSAKRIAEAHGGTISALRNDDRGTTFLVWFPLTESAS